MRGLSCGFLSAYSAQLRYVTLATEIAQPSQPKQMELLQPTSTQISTVQDYREKHRSSPFFNHLSAISEYSRSGLGVCGNEAGSAGQGDERCGTILYESCA